MVEPRTPNNGTIAAAQETSQQVETGSGMAGDQLNEEYHLLSSFACPNILRVRFPADMFKVVSMATVMVNLQSLGDGQRVCGQIAARIRDKHRNRTCFRVGSMLFTRTVGKWLLIELARSVVAVPSGWVLHLEVDLHIESSNSTKDMKHLKFITLMSDNDNETKTQGETYDGVQVEVKITRNEQQTNVPLQLTCPVEVKMESGTSGYLTLVYTIGDEMSFTEFIMALRHILADHPNREELLDGHHLLNLSSSREHPVLARQRPVQPSRWLRINLQVVEEGKEPSWTTLIMRDDNLYVHGFFNKDGDLFQLQDKDKNACPIPTGRHPTELLKWGVSYTSMLDGKSNNPMEGHSLCGNFVKKAVRVLSNYKANQVDGNGLKPRVALAGLILMVCESARMNPLLNFFEQGWSGRVDATPNDEGKSTTNYLMKEYVRNYSHMSSELRTWKSRCYAKSHPIKELQAIYLVLNTMFDQTGRRSKTGNASRDGASSKKPGNAGNGGGPPSHHRGGSSNAGGGGGGGGNRRDINDGSNGGPQSHQHKKAYNAGSSSGPTCKSEDTSDAGSGGGHDSKSEESSDADGGGSPEAPDSQSKESDEETSDDSGSSGGNGSGQPGDGDSDDDDDDPQCPGRPRVELLSIRADLGAIGKNITIFDGKRGQIIYTKEKQGEKGKWEDLELTGPYRGISAYGCFAIVIDIIPGDTSACSSGDAGGSIQWEWDCYDPEYGKEVDQEPVTCTIGNIADVTYAVMSNAREATVKQVKLRLKNGPTSHGGVVSGKITALIHGFKDEHKSVLFRRAKGNGQRLSATDDNSCFLLQLARNVVPVPCSRALHMQVDLQIVSEDGKEVEVKVPLRFDNGIGSSNIKTDKDGNEVEVEVTWYPERMAETAPAAGYGIGHILGTGEWDFLVHNSGEQRMAEAAPAAGRGIRNILSTDERDFLVRNSGEQQIPEAAPAAGSGIGDMLSTDKQDFFVRNSGEKRIVEAAPAASSSIADILGTGERDFLVRNSGEQRMAEAAPAACSGIGDILGTGERDFLVRNSGEQMKISSIEASPVAIYFSASWCPPCRRFTPKLIEAYKELASQGKSFEVVFASADQSEEAFSEYFAKMPWLAVPFSDTEGRKTLDGRFKVSGIPHLVILDAKTGEVYTENGVEFVSEYDVEAYPFTPDRINELKEIEKAEKDNQTLQSVLGTSARDYLISNKGDKVPISELEGNYVGLCFVVDGYGPVTEFTDLLAKIYGKLKEVGEKFEVVAVSLDSDESAFNESFAKMPWLAIPQGDQKCEKLVRYFELRSLPTLVLIGPDGKTLNSNVADIIDEHGFEAWEGFPYSAEKLEILAEKEKAKAASQTLESLLISGDLDFVIGKDGAKVPVSELVGKTVLLYFSAKWCGPCRAFLPTIVNEYNKIKEKNSDFEIVFISSDRDQSSFDDFFSEMPWLAVPLEDERKASLKKTFRIRGIPSLVAIGPTGQTVSRDAKAQLMIHGADAFPFTEERLEELQKKLDEMAKGWPQKLKHELHDEHKLVLLRRGTYGCDGCEEMGSTWSYRCDECDFDLHPKCALGEEMKGEEEEGKSSEEAPARYVCEGGVCRKV